MLRQWSPGWRRAGDARVPRRNTRQRGSCLRSLAVSTCCSSPPAAISSATCARPRQGAR
jgi:hypothetical protein